MSVVLPGDFPWNSLQVLWSSRSCRLSFITINKLLHPKDADRMANSVNLDQTAPLDWVYTVCSRLVCRKVQEHMVFPFYYCLHTIWIVMFTCSVNRLCTNSDLCHDDCAFTLGSRQVNLVLIAYASSEGSGEPAHPRSLARTFAARSYK